MIAFVLFTFLNGFGGSIISNYFKGVYPGGLGARALEIEELPGVVGVFVITLSGMWESDVGDDQFLPVCGGNVCPWTLISGYLNAAVCVYSLRDHIVMRSGMRSRWITRIEDKGTFLRKIPGICDGGIYGGIIAYLLSGSGTEAFWFRRTDRSFPSFCVSLVVVAAALFFPVETEKRGSAALMCGSMMRKRKRT